MATIVPRMCSPLQVRLELPQLIIPPTGMLTLTGPASVADFQSAFRSVTYENTNTFNPSIAAVRTITFRINDGTVNSNTQTRTITITPTNDPPVLALIESSALNYSEGQAATSITATTTAADDNPNLIGATVQITGNYINTEDILSFTNTAAITGSFDADNRNDDPDRKYNGC